MTENNCWLQSLQTPHQYRVHNLRYWCLKKVSMVNGQERFPSPINWILSLILHRVLPRRLIFFSYQWSTSFLAFILCHFLASKDLSRPVNSQKPPHFSHLGKIFVKLMFIPAVGWVHYIHCMYTCSNSETVLSDHIIEAIGFLEEMKFEL